MKYKIEQKKALHVKIQFLFLLGVMAYCIYQIGFYVLDSYYNNKLNSQLQELYVADTNNIEPIENNESSHNNESQEENISYFEKLLAINSDVIAWINIPDTNINYPVVKGEDNEYYLKHNIKKENSISGSIFMDYRNKGNDQDLNKIIYGHNMKDGSMFKTLTNYKRKEFFLDHPIIKLDTLSESTEWEIFSVYITDTSVNYIKTNFYNKEEYKGSLDELNQKSLYDTGVSITSDDIIVTLSTCTYEFDNARFAIHAKLIK